jgi:hypothetical protein
MKKKPTKSALRLQAETIRILEDRDLAQVGGGTEGVEVSLLQFRLVSLRLVSV